MTNDWVPRSERLGIYDRTGPYEGIPDHIHANVLLWLHRTLASSTYPDEGTRTVALRLRLPLRVATTNTVGEFLHLIEQGDDDTILDAVEGALRLPRARNKQMEAVAELRHILRTGGSAYMLTDGLDLVDVVSQEVQDIYAAATTPSDEAAAELQVAWRAAFGRDPNPSDAWDHAIKALEAVLKPTVQPNNQVATLGTILRALTGGGAQWEGAPLGAARDHDVSHVVALLRLIWPNPDRHAPAAHSPTDQEARTAVTLAATLIQWDRDSFLVRKR